MVRGSELARGPLLGLKLSSISSSRGSARLISDSTRLYPAGYPGIGSVTLQKLRWIWFVFFCCCYHEKYATSSGSRIFFLQTDFILTFFSSEVFRLRVCSSGRFRRALCSSMYCYIRYISATPRMDDIVSLVKIQVQNIDRSVKNTI